MSKKFGIQAEQVARLAPTVDMTHQQRIAEIKANLAYAARMCETILRRLQK